MRKLIIDCDPGHDDAVAILMAMAHPEAFELLAITTVCGNNYVYNSTRNAQIICTAAGVGTPIAQGAVRPLINEPMVTDQFHGKTGMDGHSLEPDPRYTVDSRCAVELLRDLLRDADGPVAIAALGPLTNLALLLRTWPELGEKIEVISLMGGGLAHGNVTEYAEFNILVDPEAAQIVYTSGVPVVMSGLDVTEQVSLLSREFEFLREKGTAGRFFCELMDFYGRNAVFFGAEGCVMHDPCAVAWLLQPQLFSGRRGRVNVVLSGEERGRTVLEEDPRGPVLVLDRAEAARAGELIVHSIDLLCSPRE
jgi:pyrimidine-specific ribonucleoside hydrolase